MMWYICIFPFCNFAFAHILLKENWRNALWKELARSAHYIDVIMTTVASQITSLTIVYSTVYSDADQRKHQCSASLAFVRGIHWEPVNSLHKWPVTRKMFPFDYVIMGTMCIRDLNVVTIVSADMLLGRSSTAAMKIIKKDMYQTFFKMVAEISWNITAHPVITLQWQVSYGPPNLVIIVPADTLVPCWRHQKETFPRYWPFVRGIHRSPVNSSHKGQWRGALMFSLICVWMNDWVNNREAGDLRRHRGHYDVTVMT